MDFETFKDILRNHSTLHVTDDEAKQVHVHLLLDKMLLLIVSLFVQIMENYEDKKAGKINLEDICFNLNVDLKKCDRQISP